MRPAYDCDWNGGTSAFITDLRYGFVFTTHSYALRDLGSWQRDGFFDISVPREIRIPLIRGRGFPAGC